MKTKAELPINELGLLQELEGVDRAIMAEEDERARDSRKHKRELDKLGKQRNTVLEKLLQLRAGGLIQFPDDRPAAVEDGDADDLLEPGDVD